MFKISYYYDRKYRTFLIFSVPLIKWPGTGDFKVLNPPWKVWHGDNKPTTEEVKLFLSRQISQLHIIPEHYLEWNRSYKKNHSIQHSQLHVLGAVGIPCNVHPITAIPILLSDSQNNTHNVSTNKSGKQTLNPLQNQDQNIVEITFTSCWINQVVLSTYKNTNLNARKIYNN